MKGGNGANPTDTAGEPVDEDTDDLPTGVDEDALDADDLDADRVARPVDA